MSSERDLTAEEVQELRSIESKLDAIKRTAGDRPLTTNQQAAHDEHLDRATSILAAAERGDDFTAGAIKHGEVRGAIQSAKAQHWAREAEKFRGTPKSGTTMPNRAPAFDVTAYPHLTSTFRDLYAQWQYSGFAAIDIPTDERALSVGSQGEGTAFGPTFVQDLLAYERTANPMLDPDIVTVDDVMSGERRIYPTLGADPATGGTVTAEAASLAEIDATLTPKAVEPFKYGFIQVLGAEMAEDNNIGLQAQLATAAGREIALDAGAHLTAGTGTVQPNGVITDAGNGGTATGTATYGSNFNFIDPQSMATLYTSVAAPHVDDVRVDRLHKGHPVTRHIPGGEVGRSRIKLRRVLAHRDRVAVTRIAVIVAIGEPGDKHVADVVDMVTVEVGVGHCEDAVERDERGSRFGRRPGLGRRRRRWCRQLTIEHRAGAGAGALEALVHADAAVERVVADLARDEVRASVAVERVVAELGPRCRRHRGRRRHGHCRCRHR